MADDGQIPYNCVAWTLLEGYPWSPVYVLDPNQVRENLELLGNSHQDHLRKAREWPHLFRLVYNFGYHNISLQRVGQFMRPWMCHDHRRFLSGYPIECMTRRDVVQAFQEALYEAETFLQTDERHRLLPNMTPSDFYPYFDEPVPAVAAPTPALPSLPPLPTILQGHQEQYSHSPRYLFGNAPAESSTEAHSDSLVPSEPAQPKPVQILAPPDKPPQEQPTAPLRRTRARTQLEQGKLQADKSPRLPSAGAADNLPSLALIHEAAKLLHSPAQEKPTRQAAKKKAPTKAKASSKKVDTRASRKPKLPEPPKEAVKQPRSTPARKRPDRTRRHLAQPSPAPPEPANPSVDQIPSPEAARIVTAVLPSTPTKEPVKVPTPSSSPQRHLGAEKDQQENSCMDLARDPNEYSLDGVRTKGTEVAVIAKPLVASEPEMRPADLTYNSIVWAHLNGQSWWPAIVLDPFQVKPVLHYLGNSHDLQLRRCKKEPHDRRLLFVFGRYVLLTLKSRIRPWQCSDHDMFLRGPVGLYQSSPYLADVFSEGVREAQRFLGAEVLDQFLPYVDASDISSTAVALAPAEVQCNAVAWATREGAWWPVLVCDPRTLRSNLYHLGLGELPHLRVATGLPFHNRIVYYFGTHEFGLYKDDSMLKRWFCSQHSVFLKANAISSDGTTLANALREVQEFFVADEGSRVLLCKLKHGGANSPQMHSYTEGARVDNVQGSEIVLGLFRPTSSVAKKGTDDAKAPAVDAISSSTAIGVLNRAINSPAPPVARLVPVPHGLPPALLPPPSEATMVAKLVEENRRLEAAVAEVLNELVDAVAISTPTSDAEGAKLDTIEEPTQPTQAEIEAIVPEAIAAATNVSEDDDDQDVLMVQEPTANERSIQYAVEDLVASVEARCCDELYPRAIDDSEDTSMAADGQVDLNTVAWARKSTKHPWWPVYVCDPRELRSELHFLGIRHRRLLFQARRNAASRRLVYYFGRHTFGVTSLSSLKRWNCVGHELFMARLPSTDPAVDIFVEAVREAQLCRDSTGAAHERLPFVMPWDVDLAQVPPTPPLTTAPSTRVVWAMQSGVWWPVFVCDPEAVSPELDLGPDNARLLRIATHLSHFYSLVYFFGTHQFGLRQRLTLTNEWLGCGHETYIDQGCKDGGTSFANALSEATEFVSKDAPHELPFEFFGASTGTNASSPRQAKQRNQDPEPKRSHLESFWLAQKREETKTARKEAKLEAHRKQVYSFFKKLMRVDDDGSSSSSSGISVRSVDDSDEPESCDTEWEHSDPDSPRRGHAKEMRLGGRTKSPARVATPEKPAFHGIAGSSAVSSQGKPFHRRVAGTGGILRTAHIWKHYIWLEHMGKYYNFKYLECRHCREAYDNRGDRDIPPPKVLVSQVSKMKLHLLNCPHCSLTDQDLEPPNAAKRAIEVTSPVVELPQLRRRPDNPQYAEDDSDAPALVPQQMREDEGEMDTPAVQEVAPAKAAAAEDIAASHEEAHNDDDATEVEHEIHVPESPEPAPQTPPAKELKKPESPLVKKRKPQQVIVVVDDSDTESDESFQSLQVVKAPVQKKRRKNPTSPPPPQRPKNPTTPPRPQRPKNPTTPPPPQRPPTPKRREPSQEELAPVRFILPKPPLLPPQEGVAPEPITVPVVVLATPPAPEKSLLLQRKDVAPPPAKAAPAASARPAHRVLDLHDTIVWAYVKGFPWVPAYVLNPFKLRTELHLLGKWYKLLPGVMATYLSAGKDHAPTLKKAKQKPLETCIVYYFGTHNFGLISNPTTALRPWHCDDRAKLLDGFPKAACRGETKEELVDAIKEAECFEAADPATRLLPYMVPSDTEPSRTPPEILPVPVESMAWAISQGYPWMPVYVCDPSKVRQRLHYIGNDHYDDLMEAKSSPNSRLVYYFGSHNFGLYKMDGSLKPWNCPEHDMFLKGQSESLLYVKPGILVEFQDAMHEVEEYLSVDVESRVLPEMVPSDMNPLLDSPPSDDSSNGSESSSPDSDATVSDGEERPVELESSREVSRRQDVSTTGPKAKANVKEPLAKDTSVVRQPQVPPHPLEKSHKASVAVTLPATNHLDDVIVIDSSSDSSVDEQSSSPSDGELSEVESSDADSEGATIMEQIRVQNASRKMPPPSQGPPALDGVVAKPPTDKNQDKEASDAGRSDSGSYASDQFSDETPPQERDGSSVGEVDGSGAVVTDGVDENGHVSDENIPDDGSHSSPSDRDSAPSESDYFTTNEDEDDGEDDDNAVEGNQDMSEGSEDGLPAMDEIDAGLNDETPSHLDAADDESAAEDSTGEIEENVIDLADDSDDDVAGSQAEAVPESVPDKDIAAKKSKTSPPSRAEVKTAQRLQTQKKSVKMEDNANGTPADVKIESDRKNRKAVAPEDAFRNTRRRQMIVLDDSDDSDGTPEPAKPRSHKKRVREGRSTDEDKPRAKTNDSARRHSTATKAEPLNRSRQSTRPKQR